MLDMQAPTCHQIAVGKWFGVGSASVPADPFAFDEWLYDRGWYRVVKHPRAWDRGKSPQYIAILRSAQVPGALHVVHKLPWQPPPDDCVAMETYRRLDDG